MRKMKNNAGFSLVELIVVIAIMAILAGVGVAGYSIYTTESKKGVDRDTVAEVIRALEMGYNSGELTEAGYVVLSLDRAPTISPEIRECLEMAFGEKVDDLRLVYDKWNVSYQESSFSGKETALLGQVDTLTGALANTIAANMQLVGDGFSGYLTLNGIEATDTQKAADAAVLYVAKNTATADETKKQDYLLAVAQGVNINNLTNIHSKGTTAFGTVGGLAATYALAEGFFQSEYTTPAATQKFYDSFAAADKSNQTKALDALVNAIKAGVAIAGADKLDQYSNGGMNSQAVKDATAYVELMHTVSSAEDQLMGELKNQTAENPYSFATDTVVTDLFDQYQDGAIVIVVRIKDDNTFEIVNPLEK